MESYKYRKCRISNSEDASKKAVVEFRQNVETFGPTEHKCNGQYNFILNCLVSSNVLTAFLSVDKGFSMTKMLYIYLFVL